VVLESADDGFHWQASIEALPTQLEFVDKGKKVSVNGQVFAGPVYVARQSTLTGVAFVGQGADDNTSARIAAAAAHTSNPYQKIGCPTWTKLPRNRTRPVLVLFVT
jgi:hypothetical protein